MGAVRWKTYIYIVAESDRIADRPAFGGQSRLRNVDSGMVSNQTRSRIV